MNSGNSQERPPPGTLQRAEREARVRRSGIGLPAHPTHAAPRSGVMPDARGLVLCPFCRKNYPFSQVLLNRQLRCTDCKGVFRVSEDRRSFRIQDPPPTPTVETGSISRTTHKALKEANSSLKDIADQALRQLTSREHARPSSAQVQAHAPDGRPLTARVKRKVPRAAQAPTPQREPILSGSGEHAGKRWRITGAFLASLIVIVALGAWFMRSDPRREALWAFQSSTTMDQTWAGRVADMQQRSMSGAIDPIIAIDRAHVGASISIPTKSAREVFGSMRRLGASHWWVETARFGEAQALYEAAVTSHEPRTADDFQARCTKAGISIHTTQALLAQVTTDAPAGGEDVWPLLLQAKGKRGDVDSAALLSSGQVPTSITIAVFAGTDGGLLQTAGPPKPVSYRGRLIRCSGPGWPDGWRVLDLHQDR
jgi:hypothetical protein